VIYSMWTRSDLYIGKANVVRTKNKKGFAGAPARLMEHWEGLSLPLCTQYNRPRYKLFRRHAWSDIHDIIQTATMQIQHFLFCCWPHHHEIAAAFLVAADLQCNWWAAHAAVAYIAAAGVDVVVAAVDAVVACVGELVVDKAWAPFLSCCCREHWSSWSELAATRNRKKPEVLIDLNKLYFNFSSITFLTPVLSLPPWSGAPSKALNH